MKNCLCAFLVSMSFFIIFSRASQAQDCDGNACDAITIEQMSTSNPCLVWRNSSRRRIHISHRVSGVSVGDVYAHSQLPIVQLGGGCMTSFSAHYSANYATFFAPFYAVGRFFCSSTSNGSPSGNCDIAETANNSCAEAMNAILASARSRQDVCKQCVPGRYDDTVYYSGKMEWLQTNTCAGFGKKRRKLSP